MLDVLIIGGGIAGCNLAMDFLDSGLKIGMLNMPINKSSSLAAGIINPLVPRGLRPTWQCNLIMNDLKPYYNRKENLLGKTFLFEFSMHQFTLNPSMEKEWLKKNQNPLMDNWLGLLPQVNQNDPKFELKQIYKLNVWEYCQAVHQYLSKTAIYSITELNYANLKWNETYWEYDNLCAKNIVFCEGTHVLINPFFNWLPIIPLAGVVGKVSLTHNFNNKAILRFKKWAIPTGKNNEYIVGSTYNKSELDVVEPQEIEEVNEDLSAWATLNSYVYLKGQRPTVIDRRPIIGKHPKHNNMFVYNGFGSKGCSLTTIAGRQLINLIRFNTAINEEMDIFRFYEMYK